MSRNASAPQPPDEYDGLVREAEAALRQTAAQQGACPPPADVPAEAAPLAQEPAGYTTRDWALIGLAALEAVVWVVAFDLGDMADFGTPPGIGATVYALVNLGAVFCILGSRARLDRATIPLLAATVLLAVVPSLLYSPDLRTLNLLVLWGVSTYTVFLMAGLWQRFRASLAAVGNALAFFFRASCTHLVEPARTIGALVRLGRRGGCAPRGLWAGIGLALLLLVVVVPLLASADEVFSSLLDTAFGEVFSADLGDWLRHLFYGCAMFPLLFGLLWELSRPPLARPGDAGPDAASARLAMRMPAATQLVVLVVLDLVYLAFAAVQVVYLFGGAQTAAMQGGFSEYARQGFFQLTAVTVINTFVILLSAQIADRERGAGRIAARALACLLVGLSALILVSAALRMWLYVSAYGLTLLRLLTMLGMAFIAVLLVALLLKTLRPSTNFFAVFMTAGIALWVAFCLTNPEALIARYDIDRAQADPAFELDVEYLCHGLSRDARPEIERVADANVHSALQEELRGGSWELGVDGTLPWQLETAVGLLATH